MSKLKVLDLFSGIGGFSLGLEKAGMETAAFCEIDGPAKKVIRKHWPDSIVFNDIKDIVGVNGGIANRHGSTKLYEKVDVICGGFPCQDISIAGNKKGFEDEKDILQDFERDFVEAYEQYESRHAQDSAISRVCGRIAKAGSTTKARATRSGLWKEYLRLIKQVEPRYAIIENVANLRSKGLAQVIEDLWKIGYACEWHIISARSVGACHLRERVWIIAYPNSKRLEGSGRPEEAGEVCSQVSPSSSSVPNEVKSSHPDMPRFWRPFASEEAASRWWAMSTAGFSDMFGKVYEVEPAVHRGDDGLSGGMDERQRKEGVRQCGNSVVHQIPLMLGRAIIEYEEKKTLNPASFGSDILNPVERGV